MAKAKKQSTPDWWQNRIVKYGEQPANQFLAHELNARRHPGKQRDALRGSLNAVGWVAPVIVSAKTGKILDGHARVEEALSQGEESPVPFVEVDVSENEERTILATFDPITGLATYEREALDALLREVDTGEAALQEMLSELAAREGLYLDEAGAMGDPSDAEPQIDRAAELNKKWKVKPGDLWLIGSHRLLCGDSTNADDVARVMGGEKADGIIADPPYGMNLDTDFSSRPLTDAARAKHPKQNSYPRVIGDEQDFDLSPYLVLFDDVAEQFWWGADYYRACLPKGGSWIVWDKRAGIEEVEYTSAEFELCWSKTSHSRHIIRCRWFGLCGTESQDVKSRVHPNQKPIQVPIYLIAEHINGERVFDPFAGSGTTLVAAQNLNRRCYGIEISPDYCAVILERMSQAFPDLEIKRDA